LANGWPKLLYLSQYKSILLDMATVRFQLRSKINPANIYVRLTLDRTINIRRKSGYIIDPADWSDKTSLPKSGDEKLKQLKIDLGKLATSIEENLNSAVTNGDEITGAWLQNQIDAIQGKQKKTYLDRLTNYIQNYVDNLKYKEYPNGKRGAAIGSIKKYTTIKNKIEDFEKYKKTHFYVKDVDLNFRNELLKYFTEVDKLNSNTAGRYIRTLKTVCFDAQINGIEVHKQLAQIKGFSEKASKVFLTLDELEIIEKKTFKRSALENAKDWLIIGCYIGQRVSDLLPLTAENINVRNGLELIELVQKKTGKHVAMPIPPKVKSILNKRNGKFPDKISDQKFNLHIKDVCKLADIDELTQGAKLTAIGEGDDIKWRKEFGTFPKHELITSHVCRRSFATNFYGEIPTPLLISITAHSTERQFLEYIGKSANDYALQLAEYWNKQVQKTKKKPKMTVLRKSV
jgi:integrase